jgi:hypothetical protein
MTKMRHRHQSLQLSFFLRVCDFFDSLNSASGVILSRRAARAVSKDPRAASLAYFSAEFDHFA